MDDDAVATFCAVTGGSADQAATFLSLADGHVENAIMLFMEHGADGLSAEQQERAYERQLSNTAATMAATSGGGGSPTHRPVIVDSDDDDDDEPNAMDDDDAAAVQRALAEDDHDVGGYRAPIAPRRDVLIGGADDDYGAGPFYGNGGRGGNAHADAMLEMFGGVQTAGPVRMRDPFQLAPEEEGSASDARRRLANLFAPPHAIMYNGSFDTARDEAKSSKRFMMVTLHDPSEFACQTLNRDLWKDQSVQEVVKASFVFMQFHIDSTDGKRYKNFYPVDSLPHIAIVDPRTGERMRVWHIVPAADEFMLEVMDFLEANSLQNNKKSSTARSAADTMTEEEQMAAAIAASISANVQSGAESSSSTNNSTHAAAQVAAKSVSKTVAVTDPITILDAKEYADPVGMPADACTTLQFRTPDGKRVVKKFLKTAPVRVLFEHVKAIIPDTQTQPFDLHFQRDPLGDKLDLTLADANLLGAAINVHFK